jgi:hypothetical protein
MEAEDVCIQRVPQGRRGRVSRPGQPTTDEQTGTVVAADSGGTPRSKSVHRARGKRRLALALREPEAEVPPVVRMRRDGPNAVEKGEWKDPDDINPNRRTGRVIRGYWSGCTLRKIQRVSSQISDMHIHAAEYIRACYDIARFGFSAEQDGMPVTQIVHLPKLDFSRGAHAQAHAATEFRRIWSTLWPHQARMASAILLENRSVQAWCGLEEQRTGARPNDKVELGKLVGMMDQLAKFLDADIDDARQKGRLRA